MRLGSPSTGSRLISPRHAPVSVRRASMNSLKRSRSPFTRPLTMPIMSPAFSHSRSWPPISTVAMLLPPFWTPSDEDARRVPPFRGEIRRNEGSALFVGALSRPRAARRVAGPQPNVLNRGRAEVDGEQPGDVSAGRRAGLRLGDSGRAPLRADGPHAQPYGDCRRPQPARPAGQD